LNASLDRIAVLTLDSSLSKVTTYIRTRHDLLLSPYLAAQYLLHESKRLGRISLLGQYTLTHTEPRSGWRASDRLRVLEMQTEHAFTYDISGFSDVHALSSHDFSTGAFTSPDDAPFWVVFDAAGYIQSWYIDPPFPLFSQPSPSDPSSSVSVSPGTMTEFTAWSQSELELNVHEFMFALDWKFALNDRLDMGLVLGPTLNWFDWEYTRTTLWRMDSDSIVQSQQEEDAGQNVLLGFSGQIALDYYFGRMKQYFVEFSGGYSWIDSVHLEVGSAETTMDVEEFTIAMGVGWRL